MALFERIVPFPDVICYQIQRLVLDMTSKSITGYYVALTYFPVLCNKTLFERIYANSLSC